MKPFYLFASIMLLSLIGCSSIYQVTDFPSKEKYQEYVNGYTKNSNFIAVTIDSLINCSEGSIIKDDSLFAITKIKEVKISLKDIKETKYFGGDFQELSANILLRNGRELLTENVKILSDSTMQFTNVANIHLPLFELNKINYTNHWKGALPGLVVGSFIGFLAGGTGLVFNIKEGQNQPKRDYKAGGIAGAFTGMIIGGVLGYIVGWDNTYLFNP